MKSNWTAALPSALEPQLSCPHCDALNLPHASATIKIDERGIQAGCAQCGHYGPIQAFMRLVIHDDRL